MAEVSPLDALHYNLAAVASLGDVDAPPYDVIDEGQRAELSRARRSTSSRSTCRRAPRSVDPYEYAAETLEAWTLDGVLAADREPAIWALTQDYTAPTAPRRRDTASSSGSGSPTTARARPPPRAHPARAEGGPPALTRATRHNLSPIFALHPGDAWRARAVTSPSEPWGEVTDARGTIHRVWRVGTRPSTGDPRRPRRRRAADRRRPPPLRDRSRLRATRSAATARTDYILMALVSSRGPGADRSSRPTGCSPASPTTPSATTPRQRHARAASRSRSRHEQLDPAGEEGTGVFGFYRLPPQAGSACGSDPGALDGALATLPGLPPPRRGDPRGAGAQGLARVAEDDIAPSAGSDTPSSTRRCALLGYGRLRARLPAPSHPGRAGPRGRGAAARRCPRSRPTSSRSSSPGWPSTRSAEARPGPGPGPSRSR